MSETVKRLGFIGLGAMGMPMAQNLLSAGHAVVVYDIDESKVRTLVEGGGLPASNVAELVDRCDVIITSLPSSEVFVKVAEETLLTCCRPGQLFIDMGTVTPAEVRRISGCLGERQATLLDAPVSGGTQGARAGSLRIFVGGNYDALQQALPLLSILGSTDQIHYCGDTGSGQITKFVNQMVMGLTAAAHLEALALGVSAGIDAQLLADAVGGSEHWRAQFRSIALQVAAGNGNSVGVKVGQMPYFLELAHNCGVELPLAEALVEFCKNAPNLVVEANRPSPSFWHELTKGDAPPKNP